VRQRRAIGGAFDREGKTPEGIASRIVSAARRYSASPVEIAQLEAAVRASWDREAIAIYADHLQAIGDPRGELVAIDLRIDEAGADAAVVARRNELIAEWFGADLPPGLVRYGFVDVDATGAKSHHQLDAALTGPGAAFVRSIALAGDPAQITRAVFLLGERPHPWLTSLTIKQWSERATPTCDDRFTQSLFAHAPALRSLDLSGRRILGNAAHPTLERLHVTGFDGLASLLDPDQHWPRLATIDAAIHCQYATDHANPSFATLARFLAPPSLPALTSLDLSRNEPGHLEPRSLGGSFVASAFLGRFANHPRLATVALPALRHTYAVEAVERTLAELPAIREVTVWAPNPRPPVHPTATIREIPLEVAPPGPKRLA